MSNKLVAQIFGYVLTLVGLAGFFVGDTLLGFGINTLHNVVHLASGALGLFAGYYENGAYARDYNKWFGVTYALVTVLGFVVPGFMERLLNVNMADNILHLAISAVLIGVGFFVEK